MSQEKNVNSPSTGVSITPAQYISEIILKKWAKWKHIDSSGTFWRRMPFQKMFIFQITLANKLLKQYSARAIIQAINSPLSERCFSLGNKDLVKVVETFSAKQDIVSTEVNTITDAEAKPRMKSFGKNSSLSRLKELE